MMLYGHTGEGKTACIGSLAYLNDAIYPLLYNSDAALQARFPINAH